MNASLESRTTAWMLVGVAAVANITGYLLSLYTRFAWWDEAVVTVNAQFAWWDGAIHGYTIFAITFLLGLLIYGPVINDAQVRPLLMIVTVASVGIAIGALWELAEWSYAHWFAQNDAIQGRTDTTADLTLCVIGALVAGCATRSSLARES